MSGVLSLKVGELTNREEFGRGIVRIDTKTMKKLGIREGDIVELIGKRRTGAIAVRAYPADVGLNVVRMDGISRRNVGVGVGEVIKIEKAKVKEAKRVVLAPAQKGIILQMNPELLKKNLFMRPVHKKDLVTPFPVVKQRSRSPFDDFFRGMDIEDIFFTPVPGETKLVVVKTNPEGIVKITDLTELELKPEAVEIEEKAVPTITYEDIGGMHDAILKIREMVELPMRHPELFETLGIEAPKGVLLYGPPGTGKTLLAKAVANEAGANFIAISGPEFMSKFYGESESNLRKIFEEAQKNAPSIIFIDEIDSIAPKREEVTGEVEKRIVSQLLTLMDGLKARGKIIVIGATNRENALDPALRRPGRFDREIEIGVPDAKGRKEVLQIHTRNMPLEEKVNIDWLAGVTYGFVGADLEALAKEAAMSALRRNLPGISWKKTENLPPETLENLKVSKKDFENALKIVEPSAMREVMIEKPNVRWEDVGGLEGVKENLREIIEWPLKDPDSFTRMGINPPSGVLLYGPPGSGKTLLAKAVAKESEANFISIKGPELISKWVGESLPYDETMFILNGKKLPERVKIGDFVENRKRSNKVISFDKDLKIKYSQVSRVIKHPVNSKILEVTTKTGRKIRVTDYHSLFTLTKNGIESIETRYLKPKESYIALPKKIPVLNQKPVMINILDHLDRNNDLFVNGIRLLLKKAITKLGYKEVSKITGLKIKYLYDFNSKNISMKASKFLELMKKAKITYDPAKLEVGLTKTHPARIVITKEMMKLIGIWLAEGDYMSYGIRISNTNREIIKDILYICKKMNFEPTLTKDTIIINSKFMKILFQKVLNMKKYSKNKKIPDFVFGQKLEFIAELLKGYFSGDGSIYGNSHRYIIEASTQSKEMAEDILFLLLYFGIVAKYDSKREKNGNICHRIRFSGVENFRKFKKIGFIDNRRNKKIDFYITRKKWKRTNQIPVTPNIMELINQSKKEWKKSKTIGVGILLDILKKMDSDRKMYKEIWNLVDSEIYWDQIMKIREIPYNGYVYDISVNPKENFLAGFGGIFAHNSEKKIREVFRRAKQVAPAIIFFDEFDALAPRRGMHSGTHVTENVVSQILTEMSGLEDLHQVVVLAATNRPDMIDPALLRPGRFDRQILVPAPDQEARFEVLKIHTKKMPLKGVDLKKIAKETDGFSGADLESIVREAGLNALRENMKAEEVKKSHFEKALKKAAPSITPQILEFYKKMDQALKSVQVQKKREEETSYVG